jgi:hypothetical protein
MSNSTQLKVRLQRIVKTRAQGDRMLESVDHMACRYLSGGPKLIGAWGHLKADAFVAAIGIAAGALFWRAADRRSAAAAFTAIPIEAVNIVATDFSGGSRKLLRLSDHGRVGLGNALTIALFPVVLGLKGKAPKLFFPSYAAAAFALIRVTNFTVDDGTNQKDECR